MASRWILALVMLAVPLGLLVAALRYAIVMPGRSHGPVLPRLTAQEQAFRLSIASHVERLAGEIGERHLARYEHLQAASLYVQEALRERGYMVATHGYELREFRVENIVAERRGVERPDEVVLVGAHYDSVQGSPGANDNATGVAALLELAQAFAARSLRRTIRFVGFVNEEPPFFQTRDMGSLRYVQSLSETSGRVVAMLSLETIGAYSDTPGSQNLPVPLLGFLYPDTANFIAFVGNVASRPLVHRTIASFRRQATIPSEGIAAPALIPGIDWSDQWAFWQAGIPAVMITDTAFNRYVPYHTAADTPDKIDYDRTARVVAGLVAVIAELADAG